MARYSDSVPIGRNYGQQITLKASGGEFVSLNKPRGYDVVLFETDGGTQGARVSLGPRIRYVYHYDASLTGTARWVLLASSDSNTATDYAMFDALQTATRITTAMVTADYLYIATDNRVKGYFFDLGTKNSNNQTMTFEYSNTAGFTATAITDGTNATGTMREDGDFVIDAVPAEGVWTPQSLQDLNPDGTFFPTDDNARNKKFFWGRLDAGGTLSDFVIEQLMAIDPLASNTGTAAGAGQFAKEDGEYSYVAGFVSLSAISIDSGVPKLNVSWFMRHP